MKIYLTLAATVGVSAAFSPVSPQHVSSVRLAMAEGPAGSFFNQVPDDDDDDDEKEVPKTPLPPSFDKPTASLVGQSRLSEGVGFGDPKKPYVALGPPDKPINSVTTPELDKDGYTVYTDEKTGEKSRVFEALVKYPCKFMMKIVGASEGTFVDDLVQIVAESCDVGKEEVPYTTREMGKWTSITVKAPVASAEMLYSLYENIAKDPRVKFKF